MADKNFVDVTEDDFAPRAVSPAMAGPIAARQEQQAARANAPADTEDYSRGMSDLELFGAGIGGNLSAVGRGVQRAGLGAANLLPGVDLSRQMSEAEGEAKRVGDTMRDLRKTTPGWAGDVTGSVVTGAASTPARGAGVVRNALRTGAAAAPMEAAKAYGEGSDAVGALGAGAVAGAAGAAGSTLFDVATKGINAVRGEWGEPMKKYLRDFSRDKGVELRTGDLHPESVMRRVENIKDFVAPGTINKQTEALSGALFGKQNEILTGIGRAKSVIDAENVKLWEPVYQAAQQGTTNVRPIGLYQSLGNVINKYPQVLDKIENQEVRRTLESIAASGGGKALPGLTFREMRELQQAIGPEIAAMRLQVANGSMTRGQAEAASDLYKSIHADLSRWGNAGQNQKAYDLYKTTNEEFKNSFLPFYENDIVTKATKGIYDSHNENLIQDLLRPLGRTQREQLLWYLGKTDHDSAGYLELLKAANRAGKALKNEAPEPTVGMNLGATLFAPKAAATAAIGGMGSSKLLPWYSGRIGVGAIPERIERGLKGGLGQATADRARR